MPGAPGAVRFALAAALAVAWEPVGLTAAEPSRLTPAPGRALKVPSPAAVAGERKVDRAVQQAGGTSAAQGRCSHCRQADCPRCHTVAGHARILGSCHEGPCAANCPVRPDVFGFYGTSWRRWPGVGVTPVANEEAVTPAVPPMAEVPRIEEESASGGDAIAPEPPPEATDADP